MDLSEWDSLYLDFTSNEFQNEMILTFSDETPSLGWPVDDPFSIGTYSDFQLSAELQTMAAPSESGNSTEPHGMLQNLGIRTRAKQNSGQQEGTTPEGHPLPLEEPQVPYGEQQVLMEQQLLGQGEPTFSSGANGGRVVKRKKQVSQEKKIGQRGHGDLVPGMFCFQANSNSPTFQQRAHHSDEHKKVIKEMRLLGACLRCKQLKKTVSYSAN